MCNLILETLDHAPEVESVAEGNFCPVSAELQIGFEGMDDMAGILRPDSSIKNVLVRAAFVQSIRRFDSRFSPLI